MRDVSGPDGLPSAAKRTQPWGTRALIVMGCAALASFGVVLFLIRPRPDPEVTELVGYETMEPKSRGWSRTLGVRCRVRNNGDPGRVVVHAETLGLRSNERVVDFRAREVQTVAVWFEPWRGPARPANCLARAQAWYETDAPN